jgi:hypothetical protein
MQHIARRSQAPAFGAIVLQEPLCLGRCTGLDMYGLEVHHWEPQAETRAATGIEGAFTPGAPGSSGQCIYVVTNLGVKAVMTGVCGRRQQFVLPESCQHCT